MNTFQQYYKDGTNGTWDCMWFAGFLIVIKIIGFVVYAISLSEIANIF